MSFTQWIGKTIQRVETKEVRYYSDYEYHTANADWIYFTDETGVVIYTTWEDSGSNHFQNDPTLCMDWMDQVCQRCGTINPDSQEDCRLGKEIEGAGTEPHVFLPIKQN